MLIAYIPLLLAIIGLLVWVLAGNATVKEIGRWLFIIGLFFTVGATAGHTHKLF